MVLELTEKEAEHLLELHAQFHDDLRQALLDIEQDLHKDDPVIEFDRFAALDESLDGFKEFTGEFNRISAEKIKEDVDDG